MTVTEDITTDRSLRLAIAPLAQLRVSDPSASGNGSWMISGYAATFNDAYTLYDGRWFVMRERIDPAAFDDVLARVDQGEELVHLNHGHDMMSAVAATNVDGIGGLTLRADTHGLRFTASVDADDPDAVRMAAKMRRGVVAQASFAFTIADEDLLVRTLDDGRDDELYTIRQVGHLYDVCVCAQGANPYTESGLRSAAAASLRVPDLGASRHFPAGEGDQGHRPSGQGPNQVTPEQSAGPVASSRVPLLRAAAADNARHLRREGALT